MTELNKISEQTQITTDRDGNVVISSYEVISALNLKGLKPASNTRNDEVRVHVMIGG